MTEPFEGNQDPLLARAVTELRARSYARGPARVAVLDALRNGVAPRSARGSHAVVPPLWAITRVAAAVVVIAGAAIATLSGTGRRASTPPAFGRGSSIVDFSFEAPTAKFVSVVGEFNSWSNSATPMRRGANGLWTASLVLEPGRHVYDFHVDGDGLVPDPSAPVAPEQMFGVRHSVVVVPRETEH
jgi:hypothetical protein